MKKKQSRWFRSRRIFRSILYCFGRSNASYFDPSIKHLGVYREHVSFTVHLCCWSQFWIHTYWLTVIYFFRYQFLGWAKKNSIDLFFLWTVPVYFTFDEFLAPFWSLYVFFDPIYYRNVNLLKWKSDWLIVSWGQYYFFYRYFKPVRYFFYFKIYWVEFWWALNTFIDALGEAREDYDGHYTIKAREKNFRYRMALSKHEKFGTPMPDEFSDKHKKSWVLINKEIFYPDKLHYYTNYRIKTKVLPNNHLKNKSWWV